MTPVQHQTLHIRYLANTDVLASSLTSVITPLLSLAQLLSLLIFMVLCVLIEAEWEAGLVEVLTFIQCICGCNGLVGTSCDRLGFVLSLSVDRHPTMMEIARDKLATYVE